MNRLNLKLLRSTTNHSLLKMTLKNNILLSLFSSNFSISFAVFMLVILLFVSYSTRFITIPTRLISDCLDTSSTSSWSANLALTSYTVLSTFTWNTPSYLSLFIRTGTIDTFDIYLNIVSTHYFNSFSNFIPLFTSIQTIIHIHSYI